MSSERFAIFTRIDIYAEKFGNKENLILEVSKSVGFNQPLAEILAHAIRDATSPRSSIWLPGNFLSILGVGRVH